MTDNTAVQETDEMKRHWDEHLRQGSKWVNSAAIRRILAQPEQEVLRLEKVNAQLLFALKMLLDDITDYQTINNLGGENNYSQVQARAAIAKAEEQGERND